MADIVIELLEPPDPDHRLYQAFQRWKETLDFAVWDKDENVWWFAFISGGLVVAGLYDAILRANHIPPPSVFASTEEDDTDA